MPLRRRTRGKSIDLDRGYELWAPSYDDERERPLPRIEEAVTVALLPAVAGRDCLDLGCGTGRYTEILLARDARRVVALDRSQAMIHRLASKRLHAHLVTGDLAALPFGSACADVVVCALAYGHVADLRAAMAEAARVLRRGGTLVFSDFHPDASKAGLSRSFDASGTTYILPHEAHEEDDYRHALHAAGLRALRVRSATARDHPEAFAGTRRLKDAERDLPIILAMSASLPT